MRVHGPSHRPASCLLPAAAFCGAFIPAGLPGAAPSALLGPVPVSPYALAAAVGALAATAAWPARRRWWPLALVAVVDAVLRSPGFLLSVAVYVAAISHRRPLHLGVYAAAATLAAVVPRPAVDVLVSLGSAPLFVWLPLTIGLWTRARRQVVAGLRDRAQRLEREQAARVGQARAQERARIARDMHDVVAHRVSLMVLRAGALEVNAPDEATAAEAELIRTTGGEALAQLRAVLGILSRPDGAPHAHDGPAGGEPFPPQPTLDDLDGLLDQSRSAGVPVERHDEGTAGELPVVVQHTAYRVVREALTNIHKHAGAAATRVVVRRLPAGLEITVANAAPRGRRPAMPGGGLGLVGLREGVELLGGEFTAGPRADGGFVVSARLPA
ncbi:histidine kinase [Sphaerisporangium sp. TRM90804]|uniref:sensor histidine kinase n=1 Tax=Sphaerisporangium sp. TRM90804 TaxID=3031113 RepID=UPI00244C63EA|nr:histidine kinase [Sphaerisporangium sp. TRM90804]MDH2428215.1 histidine kinase [Sphaerisporangium sp. TRM90804]